MKLENIKTLFENIRLGLYKSENFKLKCECYSDYATLEIYCIDKHSSISITIREQGNYTLYYQINDCNYIDINPIKLTKEEYENMRSFMLEWATAKYLINETVAIDAFSL